MVQRRRRHQRPQIVVDKLDAKLFNGAAEVIQACQKDFMLVGGGNALDAPT